MKRWRSVDPGSGRCTDLASSLESARETSVSRSRSRRRPWGVLVVCVVALAAVVGPTSPRATAGERRTVAEVRDSVVAVLDDESALQLLFARLAKSRDYATVLAAANALIDERGESAIGWQYRAYASQKLGRTGPAWEAYVRCLDVDPDNWWAWTQLGGLQAAAGRFDDALESLGEALRLNPNSQDAYRKMVLLHRDRESPSEAIAVAKKALSVGAPAAWAHTELAELHWVLQDWDKSLEHWEAAEEAGVDAKAVARGRELARFDQGSDERAEDERAALRKRRTGPHHWRIQIGDVTVVTRVGPALPPALHELILSAQRVFGDRLGVERPIVGKVELFLARTDAEHEKARRARYPGAARGRAFTVRPGFAGMRGRGGRGRRDVAPEQRLYVSYSTVEVDRSITHELAHAFTHLRRQGVMSWLDEAIATYMEHESSGPLGSGAEKASLRALVGESRDAQKLRTWRTVLGTGPNDFAGGSARELYAQSWSILHFLLHTATAVGDLPPGRRLQILLDETDGRAGSFDDALELLYDKTPQALEREWLRSIR